METELALDRQATRLAVGRRARAERWFFGGMAVAVLVTVFVGFAPTYYLMGLFGGPALDPLRHLHGALFTGWVVLFAIQTALVAAGRTPLHRRLGVAGALLAAAMIAVGLATAIASAARGFSPPGGPPPLTFFIIPFGDLVVFTTLVGSALALRRRPDAHKRLMLLATISLLTAAVARWPGVLPLGPLAFFGITDLFVVAGVVYDRFARGRVHPAFIWGGLFLILSQPLRLVLGGTDTWLAFAAWLVGVPS